MTEDYMTDLVHERDDLRAKNKVLSKQLEWAIYVITRIRHDGCDLDAQIALDALADIERMAK